MPNQRGRGRGKTASPAPAASSSPGLALQLGSGIVALRPFGRRRSALAVTCARHVVVYGGEGSVSSSSGSLAELEKVRQWTLPASRGGRLAGAAVYLETENGRKIAKKGGASAAVSDAETEAEVEDKGRFVALLAAAPSSARRASSGGGDGSEHLMAWGATDDDLRGAQRLPLPSGSAVQDMHSLPLMPSLAVVRSDGEVLIFDADLSLKDTVAAHSNGNGGGVTPVCWSRVANRMLLLLSRGGAQLAIHSLTGLSAQLVNDHILADHSMDFVDATFVDSEGLLVVASSQLILCHKIVAGGTSVVKVFERSIPSIPALRMVVSPGFDSPHFITGAEEKGSVTLHVWDAKRGVKITKMSGVSLGPSCTVSAGGSMWGEGEWLSVAGEATIVTSPLSQILEPGNSLLTPGGEPGTLAALVGIISSRDSPCSSIPIVVDMRGGASAANVIAAAVASSCGSSAWPTPDVSAACLDVESTLKALQKAADGGKADAFGAALSKHHARLVALAEAHDADAAPLRSKKRRRLDKEKREHLYDAAVVSGALNCLLSCNKHQSQMWDTALPIFRTGKVSLAAHPGLLTAACRVRRWDVAEVIMTHAPDILEADVVEVLRLAIADVVQESSSAGTGTATEGGGRRGRGTNGRKGAAATQTVGLKLLHRMALAAFRVPYNSTFLRNALSGLNRAEVLIFLQLLRRTLRDGKVLENVPPSKRHWLEFTFAPPSLSAISGWCSAILESHFVDLSLMKDGDALGFSGVVKDVATLIRREVETCSSLNELKGLIDGVEVLVGNNAEAATPLSGFSFEQLRF
jgi:hypothetical protein